MAATGLVSGINGSITFASGYVAYCQGWTVDASAAVLDKTALGDSWRAKFPGLKDWSGNFTCVLDSSSVQSLEGLALGNASAAAVFIFDDATTDGSFGGNIIIESFSVNPTVGDTPTTVTFNFQGDGAMTLTGAA